jgi:hypothetical protein
LLKYSYRLSHPTEAGGDGRSSAWLAQLDYFRIVLYAGAILKGAPLRVAHLSSMWIVFGLLTTAKRPAGSVVVSDLAI